MSDNLYDLVKEAGSQSNFSIILNKSKASKTTAAQAKRAAKAFGEFAKACVDEKFVLEAGVGDMPVVGPSGYIKIKNADDEVLVIITVPHNIIDIVETQNG